MLPAAKPGNGPRHSLHDWRKTAGRPINEDFFYLIWFTLNPKQLQCGVGSVLFFKIPITSFERLKTVVIICCKCTYLDNMEKKCVGETITKIREIVLVPQNALKNTGCRNKF